MEVFDGVFFATVVRLVRTVTKVHLWFKLIPFIASDVDYLSRFVGGGESESSTVQSIDGEVSPDILK